MNSACTSTSPRSLDGAAQECTLQTEQRDFPEWHRGRPCFAVWAIALEDSAVERQLNMVRQTLHPWLLPGYERQAHITLHICGFPVKTPQLDDEFCPAHLRAQVEALIRTAPPALQLRVGGAFSFVSAACLAVHDDTGELQGFRRALHHAAPSFDATPYVPHLTAGLYGGVWPMQGVHARLHDLGALPDIPLTVTTLDWMVYDSGRIGGPLRTMLRVELATGRVHVSDRIALDATFAHGSGQTS